MKTLLELHRKMGREGIHLLMLSIYPSSKWLEQLLPRSLVVSQWRYKTFDSWYLSPEGRREEPAVLCLLHVEAQG